MYKYLLFPTNKYILLCIIYLAVLACKREQTEPANYDAVSSVVGKEGKKLTFFADSRSLPIVSIDLYPTLTFEPQTFIEPSVIRLDIQRMSFNSLPPTLSPVSANTCKWAVLSTVAQVNKPFQIIVPFEEPAGEVWLEDYEHQFKLYRIPIGKETNRPENWEQVANATLDTNSRTISAFADNFNYAYCILFGEIQRSDNIAITSEGTINTIQSGSVTSYFSSTNNQTRGFYYRNNLSVFYYEGIWNDDFSVSFSFKGNEAGTYQGNDIEVNYRYKKNNNSWVYEFESTENTTITISQYAEIGGLITGTLAGELSNARNEKINFTMDFKLIRTR
jgi:hypothetical protein